jgi:hypothetical protein
MQNMDLYSGKNTRQFNPYPGPQDPEYFTRLDTVHQKEMDKNKRKASRMFSLILGLCIIAFTAGLVVGIKFASGSKKEIMDADTRKAVTTIKDKMSNLISDGQPGTKENTEVKKNTFPKEEYPYIIKLGREYNEAKSQEIAKYLSARGHTVILSKNNSGYRIFIGPFKNNDDVNGSLKKIFGYEKKAWFSNSQIVKRQ